MNEKNMNLSAGNMAKLEELGNTLALLDGVANYVKNNSTGGKLTSALLIQVLSQHEMLMEYARRTMTPGDLRVVRSLFSLNVDTNEGRPWDALCQAALDGGNRTHRVAYEKLIARGYKPPFGILQTE